MNLRRRHKEDAEVSTESLNDIMFFLLLFFLIVSTLVNPNVIKLFLPNAKEAQQMAKQQITLSMTKDMRYYINKSELLFEEIEPRLLAESGKSPDLTVVLRLDKDLTVQNLADLQQICARLKLKMVLATDARKG
ncbi:MAG: biopolymer transporter ExbD [Saprospiraceae bacterium]